MGDPITYVFCKSSHCIIKPQQGSAVMFRGRLQQYQLRLVLLLRRRELYLYGSRFYALLVLEFLDCQQTVYCYPHLYVDLYNWNFIFIWSKVTITVCCHLQFNWCLVRLSAFWKVTNVADGILGI